MGVLIFFLLVEGAQVYAPSQPESIGPCFTHARFFNLSHLVHSIFFFILRSGDVGHSITYTGKEHRHGVRDVGVAQKRHGSRSRRSE